MTFKKIINWLRIRNIIKPVYFTKATLLFNMFMIAFSIYLQFTYTTYIKNFSIKSGALEYLSILTTAWHSFLPTKFYPISVELSLVISIFSIISFHLIIFKIYKKLFPLTKIQLKNLEKLGFCYIEKIPPHTNSRIKDKIYHPYFIELNDRILLGTYNTNITIDDVRNKLEQLSNCFSYKLIDVTESNIISGQLVFTLHKDNFHSIIVENKSPIKYGILAGVNLKNETIVLDLKKSFSIFLGGMSGSGKTNLILNYAEQIHESVNGNLRIIIIDDKGIDYKPLIDKFNAEYYDSSTLEGLNSFNSVLEGIFKDKNISKKVLSSYNVDHAEELRDKDIHLPLQRTLIIGDEAGVFLRASTENRKEYKEIKKKIVSNMTIALSQLRAFGCPIIISTQRCNKDELDIPYDNFQVRMFNGISHEMSRKYCDGLVGTRPTLGKWYITSDNFQGFIKTPFKNDIKLDLSSGVDKYKNPLSISQLNNQPRIEILDNYEPYEHLEKNYSNNQYQILREQPQKTKYQNSHEVVSIPALKIRKKLVKKGLSDKEIIDLCQK